MKSIILSFLTIMFFVIAGCNPVSSPPRPDDGGDNNDNEENIPTFEQKLNVIKNDIPIMYDLNDMVASSDLNSDMDTYNYSVLSGNNDNVKLINNRYVVFYPNKSLTEDLFRIELNYENITQGRSGFGSFEFVVKNTNNESGLYQYNLDIGEKVNLPMNFTDYKIVNSGNDLQIDTELPDFPINIKMPAYNTYGNKTQCNNIKTSGQFIMPESGESNPFFRCLFYKENSDTANDYIKLYFTHGNTTMIDGFINNLNQVEIDFWDFDDISRNTHLNYPSNDIYRFKRIIDVPYQSNPKKLDSVFTNKVMNIHNNRVYIYSPFNNEAEVIRFRDADSIEFISQRNNTNYIIILEKSFSGDKLWKIDRDFTLQEIASNSINEGVISSAEISNDKVYFWTGNNSPELKNYNIIDNISNTVISSAMMNGNNLFDNNIMHWGVNLVNEKTVGYFIYDRNNRKSLFSFNENDTSYSLNERQNDMSVNHIVAYKMLSGYTAPYSDYATLNIVKSLEKNKTIKLFNNNLYVVLTNEYNQDELIKYSLINNDKNNISSILYTKGASLRDEDAILENQVEQVYPTMKAKVLFINDQYKDERVFSDPTFFEYYFERNIIFSWILEYENSLKSTVSMDKRNAHFDDLTTIISNHRDSNGNIVTFNNYFEQWGMARDKSNLGIHMLYSYPEKDYNGNDTLSTHKNLMNCRSPFLNIEMHLKTDIDSINFNFVERIRDFSIINGDYKFLTGMQDNRIDNFHTLNVPNCL